MSDKRAQRRQGNESAVADLPIEAVKSRSRARTDTDTAVQVRLNPPTVSADMAKLKTVVGTSFNGQSRNSNSNDKNSNNVGSDIQAKNITHSITSGDVENRTTDKNVQEMNMFMSRFSSLKKAPSTNTSAAIRHTPAAGATRTTTNSNTTATSTSTTATLSILDSAQRSEDEEEGELIEEEDSPVIYDSFYEECYRNDKSTKRKKMNVDQSESNRTTTDIRTELQAEAETLKVCAAGEIEKEVERIDTIETVEIVTEHKKVRADVDAEVEVEAVCPTGNKTHDEMNQVNKSTPLFTYYNGEVAADNDVEMPDAEMPDAESKSDNGENDAPIPLPAPIPVPIPILAFVSLHIPIPIPIPIPVSLAISDPVPRPVSLAISDPVPRPVSLPIPVPVSLPISVPVPIADIRMERAAELVELKIRW